MAVSRRMPEVGVSRSTHERILAWAGVVIAGLFVLLLLFFFVEGSVGHDGLLCELGYDLDGAGGTTSGCG